MNESWHSVETGHVLTSWLCGDQVETDGLDFKTTMQASFSVWTSKPRACPVWPHGSDGGHMASSQSLRRGETKSLKRRVCLVFRKKFDVLEIYRPHKARARAVASRGGTRCSQHAASSDSALGGCDCVSLQVMVGERPCGNSVAEH